MSSTTDVDVLILGAGLAGLACAHALEGSGLSYRVLEKDARVGGLAKTNVRHGNYHFDITGHWLHIKKPEVKALVGNLLGDELVPRVRKARIFSHGVYTHFPFQANTHGLPKEVAAECILGFLQARTHDVLGTTPPPSHPAPQTFADYILQRMGPGIAKHFMFPYNTKIWTVHPREMDASWCDRFVPIPSVEDVINGALGLSKEAMGYNVEFLYPRQGGIGRVPEAIRAHCTGPFDHGVTPVRVDLKTRTVTTNDGRTLHYRHLFNSIPLPELVGTLTECPDEVRTAARSLRWTTITYYDVAAKDHGAEVPHWVYLPEEKFKFYRVGSFTAVEPRMAPPGTRTFYVEYSHKAGEGFDEKTGAEAAVKGLVEMGLVRSPEDIIFAEAARIPVAYAIQGADQNAAKKVVLDYLGAQGVRSAGRYGAWYYSSMEDAIWDGLRLAREMREAPR
ncbi:MAG: FAD-dependent oxidoreductase [Myxococcota bacterium]